MSLSLDGKKALITGGTRGIGLAIATRFVAEGADVTVTGTKPNVADFTGNQYIGVDFSDPEATAQLAANIASEGIDILINNAGINKISPFGEIDVSDFETIQRVNVTAPFILCQAVLPSMKNNGWGRIINISSIWGKISKEQRASYSTSKFAIDGMTAALASEVARDGILVNCVAPGFIQTQLTEQVLGEAGMKEMAAQVPARRLGQPEEIAAFVVWLAGPENTYISGQNIAIDGGFTRV